jgi:hypothetical protein
MQANLQESNSPDWVDEPCKREDFLWKRSIGGPIRNINCASISHLVNFFVTPTGEFQQLATQFRDEGIELPPTTVRVTFTRYASASRRLVYVIDINPEHFGIARDATVPWGSNSWHKSFVQRDPKKIEFLEKLSRWVNDVQDRMDSAFKKDLNAFAGLRPLDEYLAGHRAAAPVGEPKAQSIEDALRSVKALFEKGLLTEAQYNAQVRAILEKN